MGLLPCPLVSGWVRRLEREGGGWGWGIDFPGPLFSGFPCWLNPWTEGHSSSPEGLLHMALSWVLVTTTSFCPLSLTVLSSITIPGDFPWHNPKDSSDHWPNSPPSALGSRCSLKCWLLSVISWLNGCALTPCFSLRSKSWRLAPHVLASATNHHPGTLCLFCHIPGTKAHGESKALWTQESDDNVQFFHSTLFCVYVLWGKCLQYS